MIKINFKEIESNESKDDIAEHNLKISDKFKKIECFNLASLSWLKNDSGRNYQNLEILLRKLELDTHLIAKPIEYVDDNLELVIPNGNKIKNDLKFVVVVSCRSKDEAINEILKYHSSYDNNFSCLELAGCLVKKNSTENSSENIHNNDSKNTNNEIINCLKKYDFKVLDGKSSINTIIEDLKNQYNKEPDKIVCGKVNEIDVFGLMINNEMVSPIGWFEKDSEYQLIDFRNINKI